MAKRMLIDSTHPEETRVAVISGNRLEEFDFESARKKQIKGNVYLAKVTRVEPSLQACFVEYGGNRHGFLAFNEIHPDYYRIPVADREALNRMVAEAMAAQDDDEEQEERRPPRARRRGRGRRRGGPGDSGEAQSAEAAEDSPSSSEPGQGDADSDHADTRSEGYQPHGDTPSGSPAHDDDAPRHDDEAPHDGARHDPAPLDMAPAERMSSEPVDDRRQDELRQDADFEPRREAYGAAGDDVAAAGDRAPSSEDAPTGPPSFEDDTGTPRHDDFSDSPAPDALTAEGSTLDSARGGDTGEPAAAEESVETVGGDEVEDVRRKHRIWQRRYKIQEVIRKRQILLVQVAKEERGNKGAALTTYISLAGRYCVLMPNTPRGGGISRKITSHSDRKRLKDIVGQLEVPDGMAVIVRTAGMERSQPELRRDLDFLLKTWDGIREKALDSTAPALIYEEANLIKRAVRDLYAKDVEEIIVDGDEGFEAARSFMSLLMPSHIKKVVTYTDKQVPLFHRYQVESQIDNMHIPSVQLRSGGYIVLSPTEALVAIDVNSGRSTRERNIEETATRTNLEAADEVARQLRLRDLAGLIVIDFIDMEESRNRHAVERRLKEALRHDRARIQVGRISPFGLLEMSRQRLRPSLVEASMMQCPHCNGAGHVRSTESMSLTVLRGVEEEGLRQRTAEVTAAVPTAVALYIFNHKRTALAEIEKRHNFRIVLQPDDTIGLSTYRILRSVPKTAEARPERPAQEERVRDEAPREGAPRDRGPRDRGPRDGGPRDGGPRDGGPRDGGPRDGAPQDGDLSAHTNGPVGPVADEAEDAVATPDHADEAAPAIARDAETGEGAEGDRDANGERRGRRRGRRGGRRRRGRNRDDDQAAPENQAERPNESTLGPFGEDAAPDVDQGGERHVSHVPDSGEPAPAEAAAASGDAPSWERARSDEGNGRDEHRDRGDREERRDSEHRPEERSPAEPVRAEARETEPAPAAEPPPPAEPAAPPKRGWWNLRRG